MSTGLVEVVGGAAGAAPRPRVSTLAWPVISTTSVDSRCLEVVEQVDAAAVGQLQVDEQDVGLQARHLDARGAQRVGLGNGEPFGFGELGQPFEGFGVVVYEEEMGHFLEVVGKGLQGRL